VSELEQMLRVQQEAFKQLLDREQKDKSDRRRSVSIGGTYCNVAMLSIIMPSVLCYDCTTLLTESLSNEPSHSLPDEQKANDIPTAAVKPMTSSQPRVSVSNQLDDNIRLIASSVEREDRSLWPSLNNLVEELLKILTELSMDHGTKQSLVRTAISMAARVKLICLSPLSLSEWEKDSKHNVDRTSTLQDNWLRNDRENGLSTVELHASSINAVRSGDDSRDSRILDLAHPMKTLIDRVKLVENSFVDDNIPDRHLYIMRDLRMRMVEFDKKLSADIANRVNSLVVERDACTLQLQEKVDIIKQLRTQQNEAIAKTKQTYDLALKQALSSHEHDAHVAFTEISQLKSQLSLQQQLHLRSIQSKPATVGDTSHVDKDRLTVYSNINDSIESVTRLNNNSDPLLNRASIKQSQPGSTSSRQLESDLKASTEFNRMQRLLNITSDELEESRARVVELESKHRIDMEGLSSQLISFRQAHDAVVRDLERQLEDQQQQQGGPHSNASIEANAREAYELLRDKFHSLELKYKLKCSEYDTVLQSLSSRGRASIDHQDIPVPIVRVPLQPLEPSSLSEQQSMRRGTDHPSASVPTVRNQKLIDGMEKEIDGLHRSLEEERKQNSLLRSELTKVREQSLGRPMASADLYSSLQDDQLDPFSPTTKEAIITASEMVRTKVLSSGRGGVGGVAPPSTLAASKDKQIAVGAEGSMDPFLDFSRDYRIPENLSKWTLR